MSTTLLDVNVLLALAWPNHVHHDAAHRWFGSQPERAWATCTITQAGFVRVSSNRRLLPFARTPREALALLRRMVALPGHRFWPTDIDLSQFVEEDEVPLVGHRQVTDLVLLALARARGGRLATFDRSLAASHPKSAEAAHRIETIG